MNENRICLANPLVRSYPVELPVKVAILPEYVDFVKNLTGFDESPVALNCRQGSFGKYLIGYNHLMDVLPKFTHTLLRKSVTNSEALHILKRDMQRALDVVASVINVTQLNDEALALLMEIARVCICDFATISFIHQMVYCMENELSFDFATRQFESYLQQSFTSYSMARFPEVRAKTLSFLRNLWQKASYRA